MAVSSTETSIGGIEFTIGRGGLRIPNLAWQSDYGAASLADFFRNFWVVNSDRPHSFYGTYNSFLPGAFAKPHEVVLPENGDKSLVVLRSSYEPVAKRIKELGHTVLLENQGTERHQVLVPPDTTGPFSVFAEVTNSSNASYKGKFLAKQMPSDIDGRESMSFEEVDDRIEAIYESELQTALAGVVELLSE